MRNCRSARSTYGSARTKFFPLFAHAVRHFITLVPCVNFFITFFLFSQTKRFFILFPIVSQIHPHIGRTFFHSRAKFVILTSFWRMEVANGVLQNSNNRLQTLDYRLQISSHSSRMRTLSNIRLNSKTPKLQKQNLLNSFKKNLLNS